MMSFFFVFPKIHALQPLDVLVFKYLKSHFSRIVHALSFAKKDFVVSKCEFACVVMTQFEKKEPFLSQTSRLGLRSLAFIH